MGNSVFFCLEQVSYQFQASFSFPHKDWLIYLLLGQITWLEANERRKN